MTATLVPPTSDPTLERPVAAAPKGRRKRPGRKSWIFTLIAAFVSTAFLLPAVWIFIGSLRPTTEIIASMSPLSWDLFIPTQVSLDNYTSLLFERGFALALLNSLIVCIGSVLIGVVVSAMAGYALAVYRFRGRSVIFAVIVISFLVPFEAIAIPLSQLFTDWGMANTLIGLILPGIGNGLAIFNMRQYFAGIPTSYREAAMLDGASEPRILFFLYFPMSGPALVNSGLLIFLAQWTAYLWPLLIVSSPSVQVAPIALARTFGEHGADYGQNFAGAVLLSLVPAISMLLLQGFFGRLSLSSGEK